MELQTKPDARPELGTFMFWPEDPFWSFQFIRLLGQIPVGGAEFSECYEVCKDLRAGDTEGWYGGFRNLALDLDAAAARSLERGNTVSARDSLFRATNYHRTSGFFLSNNDDRHAETVAARRHSFTQAAALSQPAIVPVEVPYLDGQTLPGYLFPAASTSTEPGPAAVIFGGTDAVAEEMYFFLGRALSQRGIHVLAFDGPGQGEALNRGILGRHDWEVPARAALDFISAQPNVDPGRVAIVGQSLGGYLAARAAAHERGFAACVIWGALFDLKAVVEAGLAAGDEGMEYFEELWQRILGVEEPVDLPMALEPYNLRGVAEKIACPTLIVHGGSDTITPLWGAQETYARLTTVDKQLIVYPPETPGCTHCQVDAVLKVNDDICDFVVERLGM